MFVAAALVGCRGGSFVLIPTTDLVFYALGSGEYDEMACEHFRGQTRDQRKHQQHEGQVMTLLFAMASCLAAQPPDSVQTGKDSLFDRGFAAHE